MEHCSSDTSQTPQPASGNVMPGQRDNYHNLPSTFPTLSEFDPYRQFCRSLMLPYPQKSGTSLHGVHITLPEHRSFVFPFLVFRRTISGSLPFIIVRKNPFVHFTEKQLVRNGKRTFDDSWIPGSDHATQDLFRIQYLIRRRAFEHLHQESVWPVFSDLSNGI